MVTKVKPVAMCSSCKQAIYLEPEEQRLIIVGGKSYHKTCFPLKHNVILQHPGSQRPDTIRTPDDLRDIALSCGATPAIVNHLHSWVTLRMDDSVDGRASLCMDIMKREALEALGYLADNTPSFIQRLTPSTNPADPIDLLTEEELEVMTRPDSPNTSKKDTKAMLRKPKDVAHEPDKEPVLDLSGIDFGEPEPSEPAQTPKKAKLNPNIIYL